MTVNVNVPGPPPQVPILEATTKADAVAARVTKAHEIVTEASDWAQKGGVPTDWQGEASDAAGYARAAQKADLNVTVAAVGRAQGALTTFASQMNGLRSRRVALVDRWSDLMARQGGDWARCEMHPEAGGFLLIVEMDMLSRDIDAFIADVEKWQDSVTAAEDALIAGLGSVDPPAEGQQVPDPIGEIRALMSELVAQEVLPKEALNWSAADLNDYLRTDGRDADRVARFLMNNRPDADMAGPAGVLGSLTGPTFTQTAADRNRDGLRELFESLPHEEASLLAMLHPRGRK